jgi:hypothetical protein
MNTSTKAPLGIALIVLCTAVLCIAGCVTADIYTTVDAEGTISNYRLEVATSEENYALLEESAHQEGYATVGQMIEDRGLELGSEDVPVAYDERREGDEVTMVFSVEKALSADQLPGVRITREDEHLVYRYVYGDGGDAAEEEENPFVSGMGNAIGINFYLVMPGAIVDSNADAVEGTTAEWYLSGTDLRGAELYAKSEIPSPGLPGFSCWIAFAALCILCCGRKLIR